MAWFRSALPLLTVPMICLPAHAAGGKIPPPKAGKVILVNPGDSRISIDAIDGERKGIRSSGVYELNPGDHTIRVHYYFRQGNHEWTGNEFVDYPFTGTAGTVLRIVCNVTTKGDKGTWKLWIEDVATGRIVRTQARADVKKPEVLAQNPEFQQKFAEVRTKAEQGDLPSMYDLGLLYDRGEGVAADPAESIRWFKKAGEQGHAEALFMLGLDHQLGQGVPQNHEEAFVWFSLAAIFGDESAPYFREESEQELTPEILAKAKARISELEAEIRARKPVS